MLFLFDSGGGGNVILPLVCVLGLAFGTLITGVVAARKGSPFWIRTFWGSMALFLVATAFLIGVLSHWAFALILLLPAALFLLLFRTGNTKK